MAGHSKFKNIMHRKGAQDAKRAKIFTKVGREITVAAKSSGEPDPEKNPRLRVAISAARAVNMPNDRIKKAIQSAIGGGDGADYIDGGGGWDETVDRIQARTRQLARRQITWFRRETGVTWIQIKPDESPASTAQHILRFLSA